MLWQTCRKYGVDPLSFYRWKGIYDTYSGDGLRSGTRHSDPSVGKLKKMLAEKELEVSMLQEAYKKRGDSDPDE